MAMMRMRLGLQRAALCRALMPFVSLDRGWGCLLVERRIALMRHHQYSKIREEANDSPAKTKKTYLVQGRNSSAWTVTLILTCIYLSWSEISRWYAGSTSQSFAV